MEAITREEKFLAAAAGYYDKIPIPITRQEKFLEAIYGRVSMGGVTQDQLQDAVDDYFERNPLEGDFVKTVNGKTPDARGNVQIETGGGGLNAKASGLLIEILRNGVYSIDQSANITALATELGVTEPDEPDVPEVTLSSISATYSGGDVTVGTAVADLTGIVVTAHYSDGTSKAVTGYTLSGTIAEGSNTITVSYGGKTTTFAVTGVAESEPDEPAGNVTVIAAPNFCNAGVGNKIAYENGTYSAYFACEPNTNYKVVEHGTHNRFRFYGIEDDTFEPVNAYVYDNVIADHTTDSGIDSMSEITINSGSNKWVFVYLANNNSVSPNISVTEVE